MVERSFKGLWRNPILTSVTFKNPHNAPLLSWEVHLIGFHGTGKWSSQKISLHINILELKAVHYACQGNVGQQGRYLLHKPTMGKGSQSLCEESLTLWNWYTSHHIEFSVIYLPDLQNAIPDSLSRNFHQEHEWELSDSICFMAASRSGACQK